MKWKCKQERITEMAITARRRLLWHLQRKEIVDEGGAVSLLLNILWICFSGIELAVANALIGCFFCITIIGIHFGKQFFKIARVALFPFGAKVVRVHY